MEWVIIGLTLVAAGYMIYVAKKRHKVEKGTLPPKDTGNQQER